MSDIVPVDPNSTIEAAVHPAVPQATGDFWDRLGQSANVAGYTGLNELLAGLPDYILSKTSSPAYQQLKAEQAANPTATTIGNVAGLAGTLAFPVGGAFKAGAAGAKALGLGKTAAALGKAADIASGAAPVAGLLPNIGKGVLQAAPQALARMATGNITPGQAALGVGIGGAAGALLGALGSKISGAPSTTEPGMLGKFATAAQEENNKAILGLAGVGQRDLQKMASWHVPGRNIAERTANAKQLVHDAAALKVNQKLTTPEAVTNFYENVVNPQWNKIASAWESSGNKLLGPNAMDLMASKDFPTASVIGNADSAQQQLGGIAGDIVKLPSFQELAKKFPAHAEQLMQDIAEADSAGWQSGRQMLTDLMKQGALAEGKGATQLRAVGNAAGDVKNLWDNLAEQNAVNAGSIDPGTLAALKATYPATKLLLSIPEHAAFRLNRVAPNSNTAAKMMLGGIVGGGAGSLLGGGQGNDQNRLLDTILGATAGMTGGDILNQLTARGVSALGERAAMKMKPLLDRLGAASGGASGVTGKAAAMAPLAGAIEGKIAQGAPGAAGVAPSALPNMGQQQQPAQENPVSSPVSQQPPTLQQLMDSKSAWEQTIGKRLYQNWVTQAQFSGNWKNANQYVADMWQQTNGLSPVDSVNLLSNDQATNAALSQDFNIADKLQSINWNNLDHWYSMIGGGAQKAGPLLGLGAMLNLPGARRAEADLQGLLQVTQKDPTLESQVERIMRLPNISAQQKKKQVLEVIRSSPGILNYATTLHDLGLL